MSKRNLLNAILKKTKLYFPSGFKAIKVESNNLSLYVNEEVKSIVLDKIVGDSITTNSEITDRMEAVETNTMFIKSLMEFFNANYSNTNIFYLQPEITKEFNDDKNQYLYKILMRYTTTNFNEEKNNG